MAAMPEYSFDGWTLRAASGELVRDGAAQRLTQQPLRILIELLEHPGEVVTRERLIELLWPSGVLDYDNGLNVAVRKLRVALSDDTGTPRYIETLPRIGYRFIGKFGEAAPALVSEPPRPPSTGASPVAPDARIPAPRRLWIVAGALLVAAGAVVLLWLPMRKPVEVPAITNAEQPIVARRTTSVRAYEQYLQGIFNESRRDKDTDQLAARNFEAAIAEDPEYAEAWAGLADALTVTGISHRSPPVDVLTRARQAAQRAVELDPGLAEAHTSLGAVYMFFDRNYPAAEAEYAKARAVNERYARLWHHLGLLRAFQGRADEAVAAMRRARELEPMTLLYASNYGHMLYHSRRFEEAVAHERALLEAQPTLDQARSVLIRSLVELGDTQAAVRQLALRSIAVPSVSDAGLVYAHQGRRDEAMKEIERLKSMSARRLGVGYDIAVIYAALGDVPHGCEALDLAWRDASPFLGFMRLDPRMDPLREAPCFRELLGRFH